MTFDPATITQQTFVRHVEYHPTLDSTSALAAELLTDLLPVAPAVVLTADQSAGRGRGANSWWATSGALTFTLVLNADALQLASHQRPMIALAAGVAVREVTAQLVTSREVSIKWPNDVLIAGRKVCGILTEQRTANDQSALLIGVGINVNNSLAAAPAEVQQKAVSVFDLTGDAVDLNLLLVQILSSVENQIHDLETKPSSVLKLINRHHFLQGRHVAVRAGDRIQNGICVGVDERGALVLQDGNLQTAVIAGSVENWSS